jgi:hypothetical protein
MTFTIFLVFSLVCYVGAFVVVYKRPIITKPIEWLFKFVGLKGALECMICMPFYVGLFLSAVNMFILPDIVFTPLYTINGYADTWLYKVAYIVLDGFVAAGMGYLINSMQEYFETNSQQNWTDDNKTLLHD